MKRNSLKRCGKKVMILAFLRDTNLVFPKDINKVMMIFSQLWMKLTTKIQPMKNWSHSFSIFPAPAVSTVISQPVIPIVAITTSNISSIRILLSYR